MYKIEAEVEGKKIALELSKKEVEKGISVCSVQGLDDIIAVKRDGENTRCQFFTDPRNSAAFAERFKVKYEFTLSKKQLENFLKSSQKDKING